MPTDELGRVSVKLKEVKGEQCLLREVSKRAEVLVIRIIVTNSLVALNSVALMLFCHSITNLDTLKPTEYTICRYDDHVNRHTQARRILHSNLTNEC